MIACKVAKAGYFQGDPEKVLRGRVDLVIAVLNYDDFVHDYENVYHEINKDNK